MKINTDKQKLGKLLKIYMIYKICNKLPFGDQVWAGSNYWACFIVLNQLLIH